MRPKLNVPRITFLIAGIASCAEIHGETDATVRTIEGTLARTAVDSRDGVSGDRWVVQTDSGDVAIPPPRHAAARDRVRITGTLDASGDRLAPAELTVLAPAQLPPVLGDVPLVVVQPRFADTPNLIGVGWIQARLQHAGLFVKEVSYSQAQLKLEASNLAATTGSLAICEQDILLGPVGRAIQSTTLATGTRLVIVLPQDCTAHSDWAGSVAAATVGTRAFYRDTATGAISTMPCSGPTCVALDLGVVWFSPRSIEREPAIADSVLDHELGHTFGLEHANGLQCSVRGAGDTPHGSCTTVPYADTHNTMGGSGPDHPHFTAAQKRKLGWISATRSLRVTPSATPMSHDLVSLAAPGAAGPIELVVPLPDGTEYSIEYRTRTGFDAALPEVPATGAVQVRVVDLASARRFPSYEDPTAHPAGDTHLVQPGRPTLATPITWSTAFKRARLVTAPAAPATGEPGSVYIDRLNDVYVRVVSTTGTSARVVVGRLAPVSVTDALAYRGAPLAADMLSTAWSTQLERLEYVHVVDAAGGIFPATITYSDALQVNFVTPALARITEGKATLRIARSDPAHPASSIELDLHRTRPSLAYTRGGAASGYGLRLHPDGAQEYFDLFDPQTGAPLPISFGPDPATEVYLIVYGTGVRHAAAADLQAHFNGAPSSVFYALSAPWDGVDQIAIPAPRLSGLVTLDVSAAHPQQTAAQSTSNTVQVRFE